jgi:hypothetical protein
MTSDQSHWLQRKHNDFIASQLSAHSYMPVEERLEYLLTLHTFSTELDDLG